MPSVKQKHREQTARKPLYARDRDLVGKRKTKSPGNNNSISWCLDSLSQQHTPSATFLRNTTLGFKCHSSKRSHTGTSQELSHLTFEMIKSPRVMGEARAVAGEGAAQSSPREAEHPPKPLQRGKEGRRAVCPQPAANREPHFVSLNTEKREGQGQGQGEKPENRQQIRQH